MKTAWTEVVGELVEADEDFARTWESLSAFRRDYAVWIELSQM